MGKTSAEVKNRYNKKTYDRIEIVVLKGEKDKLKQFAKDKGFTSLNAFILDCIDKNI